MRTGTFKQYTYDASNPGSLSNPVVNTLYIDRAGILWVGSNQEECAQSPPNLSCISIWWVYVLQIGSRVDCLFTDRQGNLWIGDAGTGLQQIRA
ncbi:MAG: two-component regulator propeller domain-containing protein [Ignavibacteriaceae bacterium]|nr:two-component regulator propeller domain-containing protein [Ignavibacteriaceae bacterium]